MKIWFFFRLIMWIDIFVFVFYTIIRVNVDTLWWDSGTTSFIGYAFCKTSIHLFLWLWLGGFSWHILYNEKKRKLLLHYNIQTKQSNNLTILLLLSNSSINYLTYFYITQQSYHLLQPLYHIWFSKSIRGSFLFLFFNPLTRNP